MILPSTRSDITESAFTRSELVAVVTMLGLIALVTLPGMANAPAQNSASVCLNNHKRLAMAWSLFANDHDDRLVNNFVVADTQGTVRDRTYLSWAHNIIDWSTSTMNTNVTLMATSRLFPYLGGDLNAFKCPADVGLSSKQRELGWSRRVRSYSMNGFMGRVTRAPDTFSEAGKSSWFPNYRQFLKLSSIPKPAGIFVFLDEHPDSINEGVFINNPSLARNWIDLPGSYHDGGCSISFADGHAEMRIWEVDRTKRPLSFVYVQVPIPGGERGDHQWLGQRSSVHPTTLSASQSTNGIQVVWSSLPNYVLQTTDSLRTGTWTDATLLPTKDSGQKSATIEARGDRGFFRLIQR